MYIMLKGNILPAHLPKGAHRQISSPYAVYGAEMGTKRGSLLWGSVVSKFSLECVGRGRERDREIGREGSMYSYALHDTFLGQ